MRRPVSLGLAGLCLLAAASAAHAQGMPMRKDGLWEMTMKMSAPTPMTMSTRQCTDASEEKAGAAFRSNGPQQAGMDCKFTPPTPAAGGGWSYSSVCNMRGMTMTSRGTARGDFRTGYHMETVTRMTPAPMPQMAESRMVMDAKWLGPCPADMKPGDTIVNGRKISKAKPRG